MSLELEKKCKSKFTSHSTAVKPTIINTTNKSQMLKTEILQEGKTFTASHLTGCETIFTKP